MTATTSIAVWKLAFRAGRVYGGITSASAHRASQTTWTAGKFVWIEDYAFTPSTIAECHGYLPIREWSHGNVASCLSRPSPQNTPISRIGLIASRLHGATLELFVCGTAYWHFEKRGQLLGLFHGVSQVAVE